MEQSLGKLLAERSASTSPQMPFARFSFRGEVNSGLVGEFLQRAHPFANGGRMTAVERRDGFDLRIQGGRPDLEGFQSLASELNLEMVGLVSRASRDGKSD